MTDQLQVFSWRRLNGFIALVIFLSSIYMLTYSARIDSTDTLFLLDGVGSFLHYGDFRLDISAGTRPPLPQSLTEGAFYPLPALSSETLQVILASPLYTLAERLPGIGLAHAVYLFNVLVCALAGGAVFFYALVLGYKEQTAIVSAVLFGLGTIVWPYSKTFFQEPLTLLLLLLAALFIERWRTLHYRPFLLPIFIILTIVGAILSKGAALLTVPALVILALPDVFSNRNPRQIFRLLVVITLVIVVLLIFGGVLGITDRFSRLFSALGEPQPYLSAALQGYLLSFGGSIWGTSPVLLLAIPGMWFLHRRRAYRHIIAALAAVLIFSFVYAIRQGPDWFGGLSWPPRFLLPVLPLVFVCAFPVIDWVMQLLSPPPSPLPASQRGGETRFQVPLHVVGRDLGRGFQIRSKILIAGSAVICAYSLWVQFSGVSLWWGEYYKALPLESGGVGGWWEGLNDLRYLRWVVIPGLWSKIGLDFAWVRMNAPGWVLMFVSLAGASGFVLWRLSKDSRQRLQAGSSIPRKFLAPGLLVILFWVFAGLGLRAIYNDPFYQSYNTRLFDMLPIIRAQSQAGEVLLLSDLTYRDFFLNYGKLDEPRVVSLPFHPGEQPSPEQPPEIRSDNPDLLLHQSSAPLIHALARRRERLWLLANSGPFMPWAVRPVERFMASHYYPIRELETGPDVRLIEYSTVAAPDPYAFKSADFQSDLVYGESIHLTGYDLPLGTSYKPGEILPISLYWQIDSPLTQNFTAAWFLRDAAGAPITQGMDSEPAGGFAHTSAWQVGVPVWDNRALRLPDDLPPGDYRLWVVLYHNEMGVIENLPVAGAEVAENHIGILPTVIQVAL
jgi:hypothetical protein